MQQRILHLHREYVYIFFNWPQVYLHKNAYYAARKETYARNRKTRQNLPRLQPTVAPVE